MTDRTAGEVWIGLVEVHQRPGAGVLMDRNKAFTNALAVASNEQEFESLVRRSLGKLGFDMISIEDAEPLAKRLEQFEVDEELLELAKLVEADRDARFGSFHTWIREE